jgi:ubiquinone biosynthesis UbiH/UbiF/VisC/COQ6 family hydroxylase
MKNYDIIIIGAGPAGLSFARSFKDTKLQVLVLEKSPLEKIAKPAPDGREIALTHLSLKIMTEQKTWQALPQEVISPIQYASVVNGDSPYSLDFDHKKAKVDALGYLVPNYQIRQAIYNEVVNLDNIEILTDVTVEDVNTDAETAFVSYVKSTDANPEMVTAQLVVAADSRFSATRRKMGIPCQMRDFSRTAIVCRMQHELPHKETAYECFYYGRTMAILPMNNSVSSVVITMSSSAANTLMNMSDESFNLDIEHHFQNRLGKMTLLDKRYSYPLIAIHADRFYANRFAVIGDASVGMHPVTAHGFNLGLQGQHILATAIKDAATRGKDIASQRILKHYNFLHQQNTRPLYHGTNGIVTLFTSETLPAKLARKAMLHLANNAFPLKKLISNKLTEANQGVKLPKLPLPFFIR